MICVKKCDFIFSTQFVNKMNIIRYILINQQNKPCVSVDIFKSLCNKCLNLIGIEILLLSTLRFSHQLTNIQHITIISQIEISKGLNR